MCDLPCSEAAWAASEIECSGHSPTSLFSQVQVEALDGYPGFQPGPVLPAAPASCSLPSAAYLAHAQVAILEQDHGFQPCTHLEHANYLGRELQRAEFALISGQQYVQD